MALFCCNCGSEITFKRKKIAHINVCRDPPVIQFCNQQCKLDWIFNKSDSKIEKEDINDWNEKERKFNFDSAVSEKKTDELDVYLKENNLEILRDA